MKADFSVHLRLTGKAGINSLYTTLTMANMTGFSRLLVRLGWPMVLFFLIGIHFREQRTLYWNLFYQTSVTSYAFTIPRLLDFLFGTAYFIGRKKTLKNYAIKYYSKKKFTSIYQSFCYYNFPKKEFLYLIR
jgi:hypothetical protein